MKKTGEIPLGLYETPEPRRRYMYILGKVYVILEVLCTPPLNVVDRSVDKYINFFQSDKIILQPHDTLCCFFT